MYKLKCELLLYQVCGSVLTEEQIKQYFLLTWVSSKSPLVQVQKTDVFCVELCAVSEITRHHRHSTGIDLFCTKMLVQVCYMAAALHLVLIYCSAYLLSGLTHQQSHITGSGAGQNTRPTQNEADNQA